MFTPLRFALLLGSTCSLLLVETAVAGDLSQAVLNDKMPREQGSLCDLFDKSVLYRNDDFRPFQKFALSGRFQVDAAFFEADQGDYDSLEVRRFRYGFKSKHFDDFTIHAEADLDLVDSDPLYNRLTDAYLGWSRSEKLEIKIGKHGAPFTLDGATSSKELLRTERGLLSTNFWFPEEYFTGASASGVVGKWEYTVGFFSSDGGSEFGDFEAGNFSLLSIGYDFAETLGLDRALLRGDYVHNDISGRGLLGTRNLTDVGSLTAMIEQGRWGLRTDLSAANGFGSQSDLFGLVIMPYYNLSDEWQLVASYDYVTSEDPNGVRLNRYESRIEKGRADAVHEFYFGVNRYLCGNKLKWQTGLQYTTAADGANDGGAYDGWGLTSGIRIAW